MRRRERETRKKKDRQRGRHCAKYYLGNFASARGKIFIYPKRYFALYRFTVYVVGLCTCVCLCVCVLPDSIQRGHGYAVSPSDDAAGASGSWSRQTSIVMVTEPPFRRSESPPGTPPRGGARRLVWSRTWFVLNTAAYAFNRSRPLLYTDLAYRCFIKVPHLASSTPTIFSLYHHSSDLYAFIIMKMCNSNYKICIYMPLTL